LGQLASERTMGEMRFKGGLGREAEIRHLSGTHAWRRISAIIRGESGPAICPEMGGGGEPGVPTVDAGPLPNPFLRHDYVRRRREGTPAAWPISDQRRD